jgi:hypothetical protein
MDALAVQHGHAFEGYRKVQAMPADSASTEQLRESMIHYRALFEDLTGLREGQAGPRRDRVAEIRDGSADAPAADRELAAENRDAAARERGLAAENRPADTPR